MGGARKDKWAWTYAGFPLVSVSPMTVRPPALLSSRRSLVPPPNDEATGSSQVSFEAYARTTEFTLERVPVTGMPDECGRVRLIADLALLAQVDAMPGDVRDATLKLIGWLARRLPNELPHRLGTLPPPPTTESLPPVSSKRSSSRPPAPSKRK